MLESPNTPLVDDIQAARRAEGTARALSVSPSAGKLIAGLRDKAAALAAAAAASEADQVQNFIAMEALLCARADALALIPRYTSLLSDAQGTDASLRAATERLVKANQENDPGARRAALGDVDSLVRLAAIAPHIPALLGGKKQFVEDTHNQILALASKAKIELAALRTQYRETLAAEPSPKLNTLLAGFAGILE